MIIVPKIFEFELTPDQILTLESKVTDQDIQRSLQLAERTVRVLPSTDSPHEYILQEEEA